MDVGFDMFIFCSDELLRLSGMFKYVLPCIFYKLHVLFQTTLTHKHTPHGNPRKNTDTNLQFASANSIILIGWLRGAKEPRNSRRDAC